MQGRNGFMGAAARRARASAGGMAQGKNISRYGDKIMNESQNLLIVVYVLCGAAIGALHKGSVNVRFAVGVFFPIFMAWSLLLGVLELVGVIKSSSSSN